MTPFMLRVADLVGEDPSEDPPLPVPETRLSRPVPINRGNDRQVAVRALAEQLVCEANAVIANEDDHMFLTDDVVGDEMVFTVTYRGREARVSTAFRGGQAQARLVADGLEFAEPRQLVGPEAVADLLLLLLMESDLPRHPHA